MKLQNAKVLNAREMKNITGGARMQCSCTNHAGTWTGNYTSSEKMYSDLNKYCENGAGSCFAVQEEVRPDIN